jgi:hypothetical protein
MNRPTRVKKLLHNLGLMVLALLMLTVIVLVIALFVVRLPRYPAEQADSFLHRQEVADLPAKERSTLEKELLVYETDQRIKIWTAIVQALAGTVLLLGLVFTWLNLRATQAKLDIDREGQLTNRFTQAAGQLGAERKDGAPNIEVRLGGIYALARIAQDSPRDYGPIMEVLAAYVRYNAPWPPGGQAGEAEASDSTKPRTDVQAILTIIGRSAVHGRRLDLRRTDLRGAEFWDADLRDVDFWGAHLDRAQLWGADLSGAKLENASLKEANLRGAKLSRAILIGAFLEGADLREADLRGTDFTGSKGFTPDQIESGRN